MITSVDAVGWPAGIEFPSQQAQFSGSKVIFGQSSIGWRGWSTFARAPRNSGFAALTAFFGDYQRKLEHYARLALNFNKLALSSKEMAFHFA